MLDIQLIRTVTLYSTCPTTDTLLPFTPILLFIR